MVEDRPAMEVKSYAFSTPEVQDSVSYMTHRDGKTIHLDGGMRLTARAELVHSVVRGYVLAESFTCVPARIALIKGTYRLAFVDGELGSPLAARALGYTMERFVHDLPHLPSPFRPLLVSFDRPRMVTPVEFHYRVWDTMQLCAEIDQKLFAHASDVSSDPMSEDFGFSCAGRGWFINAGYCGSERDARSFAWPTFICNLQSNFDELKATGRFERIRDKNRSRDVELQGSENPYLAEKGEGDQWHQVTSLSEPSLRCPFVRTP